MSVRIETRDLSVSFGETRAIKNISLQMLTDKVTAIIGPSGCGKSTFIKSLNRMNEITGKAVTTGEVLLDGTNIYDKEYDVIDLRRRVGMIFQKPNPFPKSIYDNVAYGPKIHGKHEKPELDRIVEGNLRKAALWDEVCSRLQASAMELSGGQQQRLCLARALAVEPDVILMDEPCSALDPIATAKIETLIRKLSEEYTVAIVTHNMQQASPDPDSTAFQALG